MPTNVTSTTWASAAFLRDAIGRIVSASTLESPTLHLTSCERVPGHVLRLRLHPAAAAAVQGSSDPRKGALRIKRKRGGQLIATNFSRMEPARLQMVEATASILVWPNPNWRKPSVGLIPSDKPPREQVFRRGDMPTTERSIRDW